MLQGVPCLQAIHGRDHLVARRGQHTLLECAGGDGVVHHEDAHARHWCTPRERAGRHRARAAAGFREQRGHAQHEHQVARTDERHADRGGGGRRAHVLERAHDEFALVDEIVDRYGHALACRFQQHDLQRFAPFATPVRRTNQRRERNDGHRRPVHEHHIASIHALERLRLHRDHALDERARHREDDATNHYEQRAKRGDAHGHVHREGRPLSTHRADVGGATQPLRGCPHNAKSHAAARDGGRDCTRGESVIEDRTRERQ